MRLKCWRNLLTRHYTFLDYECMYKLNIFLEDFAYGVCRSLSEGMRNIWLQVREYHNQSFDHEKWLITKLKLWNFFSISWWPFVVIANDSSISVLFEAFQFAGEAKVCWRLSFNCFHRIVCKLKTIVCNKCQSLIEIGISAPCFSFHS